MVKQSLEKRPNIKRGITHLPRLDRSLFPPRFEAGRGKSLGNSVVEVATPKRTKQSDRGNE